MKKYSWIVALLLALTLGFMGCPNEPSTTTTESSAFTSDLVEEFGTGGEWEVTLEQTRYSDGVQVQMDYAELMQGNKVTTGDVYELEITFTVDRLPTKPILFYLVDNTEAPDYWRKLTNVVEIDPDDLTIGTPYTVTLSLTASGTASSAAVAANKLCIETQEGKATGSGNDNWVKNLDDLKMTFTTFKFSRLGDVYAVRFIAEGGEFEDGEEEYSIIVNGGSAIGNKAPANPTSNDDGLEFDYWCAVAVDATEHTSHTPFVMTTPINGPIILHAVWKAKEGFITVTFKDAKDGNDIEVMSVAAATGTIDKPYVVLEFESEGNPGYDFVDWFNAADDTAWDFDDTVGTVNIVLYPTWELAPDRYGGTDLYVTLGTSTTPVKAASIATSGKGTLDVLADETGFKYTYAQTGENIDYENGYVTFSVDLGAGKTLADYGSVTFTYKGLGGDVGWKPIWLYASSTAFTGHQPTTGGIISQNYSNNGLTAAEFTLSLANASTVPGQTVHFIIAVFGTVSNAGLPTSYEVYDIKFNPTVIVPVDIKAIPGVTAPVRGATPVTSITATDQYTGTVAWAPKLDDEGKFAAGTVYTATITLAAKNGFTFDGVAANYFTVNDSPATNTAGSGVVSITFPATTAEGVDTVIDIAEIGGVKAPVLGKKPAAAITATAQYTGTVEWTPAIAEGDRFAAETAYTAAITLTAETGYTYADLGEDFFSVAGATTVTFDDDTGIITAVFPATGAEAATGPQLDGSYVLDPADGWDSWYGATASGNAVSITTGGIDYLYPVGFDVTEYNSVVFTYTCVIDQVGTDDKGNGGAKTSFKGVTVNHDTSAKVRSDMGYPGFETTGGTLTFDSEGTGFYNHTWAQFIACPDGFCFQRNDGDTSDQFTITFTSIVFNE